MRPREGRSPLTGYKNILGIPTAPLPRPPIDLAFHYLQQLQPARLMMEGIRSFWSFATILLVNINTLEDQHYTFDVLDV